MKALRDIVGCRRWQRTLAVLASLAMFYFATGGACLHQHKGGPERVCHVCQSLNAPALAAAASTDLLSFPQVTGWHVVRPLQIAALDEFCFYPSGRAPPSA